MSEPEKKTEIQPLKFTIRDLENIITMSEVAIKTSDLCNELFGSNRHIQMRAIAADIQARCELEIMRQGLIARGSASGKKEPPQKPVTTGAGEPAKG